MTTKRKPYVRPMTSTRWKKLPFYRFYMVREGTAVPTVWFSIVLIYGLFAPQARRRELGGIYRIPAKPGGGNPQPDYSGGGAATPKPGLSWRRKPPTSSSKAKKMGPEPVIKGLWVVTAVVTVVILFVALFW